MGILSYPGVPWQALEWLLHGLEVHLGGVDAVAGVSVGPQMPVIRVEEGARAGKKAGTSRQDTKAS